MEKQKSYYITNMELWFTMDKTYYIINMELDLLWKISYDTTQKSIKLWFIIKKIKRKRNNGTIPKRFEKKTMAVNVWLAMVLFQKLWNCIENWFTMEKTIKI